MRINVADLLLDGDLNSSTFTRLRPATTYSREGEAANTYSSTSLRGIVQPAATTDANLLPEGVRISDVQAVYTAGDVSAGNYGQLADIVQYGGISYRVLHVQDFSPHGLKKVLAQRYEAGEVPAPEDDDDGST